MKHRNERTRLLTRYTGDLLGAMVVRDVDMACEAMDTIIDEYGDMGVFAACYTAAEITRKTIWPNTRRGDGTLTGDIVGVEQNPMVKSISPNHLWAARFLAAYVNGDNATTKALFFSNDQAQSGGVIELLKMCADVVRDDVE